MEKIVFGKNFHYAFNVKYYDYLFHVLDEKQVEEEIANINAELLKETFVLEDRVPYGSKCSSFDLKTGYPGLLIGIGNQHESKQEKATGEFVLGFCLDYVTGLPYIPGSSIKGLIRSAFNEKVKNHQEYVMSLLSERGFGGDDIFWGTGREYLSDTGKKMCKAIESCIFDGIVNGKSLPIGKRDIFYDAQIVERNGKIILPDTIAPHASSLGKGEQKYAMPVPINFIKVGPEVTFKFIFRLHSSEIQLDGINKKYVLTEKQKLFVFQDIIMDLGIGAKTNVGYGVLDE